MSKMSMASAIKIKMEGGSIFGGAENEARREGFKANGTGINPYSDNDFRKAYQQELKQQLDAKNKLKEEAKRRQLEEDKRDEERIQKELGQLREQYQREAKDENKNKDPFDFSKLPDYQPQTPKPPAPNRIERPKEEVKAKAPVMLRDAREFYYESDLERNNFEQK